MQLLRGVSLILIIQLFYFSIQAQNNHCGTNSKQLIELRMRQPSGQPNISGKMLSPATTDTLVIPVVVHILYNTNEQNLSDEQIKSGIDVINEDFAGMSATTFEIPDVWKNLVTDAKIRFCLATATPGINPQNTNGIIRTFTNFDSFNYNDSAIKKTSLGGSDSWGNSGYLNIWVCNINSGILGFSSFPGEDSMKDGVVVNYKAFGRKGDLLPKYFLSRTVTHEIGHYFNLVHIWGDDDPSFPCTMDDFVFDTPLQAGPNYCCPGFPQYDACQTNGDGIMYMNFMDYSDDKFMEFFTPDQIVRMDTAINNFRSSLFLSQGCSQPVSYNNDLSLEEIITPVIQSYNRCFNPVIRVLNRGTQPITGFNINYNILKGNTKMFFVEGTLAPGQDILLTLPEISGKDKINILEVRILEADSNLVNNYASRSFYSVKENTKGCDDGDPLIYPNPVTSTSFCVVSNFTSSQDLNIRVINILGEIVAEQSVKSNPGDKFSINLENTPSGVYFVQMIGEESGSRSSKLIYMPGPSSAIFQTCE